MGGIRLPNNPLSDIASLQHQQADAPAAPTAAAHAAAAHADGPPRRASTRRRARRTPRRATSRRRACTPAPRRARRRRCSSTRTTPLLLLARSASPRRRRRALVAHVRCSALPACWLAGRIYIHIYRAIYSLIPPTPLFFEIHHHPYRYRPPTHQPTHDAIYFLRTTPTLHPMANSYHTQPRTTLCTARLYFLFFAHKRRPFLPSLPSFRRAVRSLSLSFLACSNCSCSICSLLLFFSLSASMMLSTRPTRVCRAQGRIYFDWTHPTHPIYMLYSSLDIQCIPACLRNPKQITTPC